MQPLDLTATPAMLAAVQSGLASARVISPLEAPLAATGASKLQPTRASANDWIFFLLPPTQ